ncbi:hypothetical protein AMJ80_05950 [bacterium SM23_31]|nr:MAG: hypothetical protein AMJ80_05950 [bacterium SM23_31]
MLDLKYFIGIGLTALLIIIFFFQIRRIWHVRYIMKNFLKELKKFNNNIDNLINYINGKSETEDNYQSSSHAICKNCIHRLTYFLPDSPTLFSYKCKLNRRAITLHDTCKRFKKDLQDTQI